VRRTTRWLSATNLSIYKGDLDEFTCGNRRIKVMLA
jgi:hypothetical protein